MPILELSSGIYAAAAVVSAWRTWRRQGIDQAVEVALYDVGVNMMTTFLPGHFGGGASFLGQHRASRVRDTWRSTIASYVGSRLVK